MTVIEYTLSGLLIAILCLVVGKIMAEKNKVTEKSCSERRKADNDLLVQKIEALSQKIDQLYDMITKRRTALI